MAVKCLLNQKCKSNCKQLFVVCPSVTLFVFGAAVAPFPILHLSLFPFALLCALSLHWSPFYLLTRQELQASLWLSAPAVRPSKPTHFLATLASHSLLMPLFDQPYCAIVGPYLLSFSWIPLFVYFFSNQIDSDTALNLLRRLRALQTAFYVVLSSSGLD